jgi:FSR family fosmidomycin resistance protein-like MFS transporter
MSAPHNAGEIQMPQGTVVQRPVFAILLTIGLCHCLNDIINGLVPALYPLFKNTYSLSFAQIGLITLTYQTTSSLVQPLVGFFTDRRPQPFSLVAGMGVTLAGLISLSQAGSFHAILLAATAVGVGSAVFHPESSRVARLASGGQPGLAQSIFQVGGNFGFSLGPLLAAFIVIGRGQRSVVWFALCPMIAMVLLSMVGTWYKHTALPRLKKQAKAAASGSALPTRKVVSALAILLILIFSKFFYLSSINTYYTFYLISKFHLTVQNAQLHLFLFLGSAAAGTLVGGPVGDRIGRKYVIWASIAGVLPFTLLLPYANLFWTSILTVIIGVILSSAFAAILVYAQELIPGKVGMVSGMFFGFAFGIGGLGAALLGKLADHTSIYFVYRVCSFLPAIGLFAYFLPNFEPVKPHRKKDSPPFLTLGYKPEE